MSYRPRFSSHPDAKGSDDPRQTGSERDGTAPRPFLTEDDMRERRRMVGMDDIVDAVMTKIGGGKVGAGTMLSAAWDDIVGPEFASRTRPGSCDSGRLMVLVADGATASKMRFSTSEIIQKVTDVLGDGVVDRISFRVTPGLRR